MKSCTWLISRRSNLKGYDRIRGSGARRTLRCRADAIASVRQALCGQHSVNQTNLRLTLKDEFRRHAPRSVGSGSSGSLLRMSAAQKHSAVIPVSPRKVKQEVKITKRTSHLMCNEVFKFVSLLGRRGGSVWKIPYPGPQKVRTAQIPHSSRQGTVVDLRAVLELLANCSR
jgi:hypothetical protein